MVKHILDELNEDNSTLYKRDVLAKHKDNELFKRVCAMAYDKVKFTYGITLKNIPEIIESGGVDLEYALDEIEDKLVTRAVTGNAAIEKLHTLLSVLNEDDRYILERVIDRDLKIGIGRTEMNKVWKGLITKPAYMRCGIMNAKTLKKIDFERKAILQLKADGTYRTATIESGNVTFETRAGEESEYPLIEEAVSMLPDGVLVGELMVHGETNRAVANGLINSSNPPHEDIYLQVWDFVMLDEFYTRPKDKNNKTPYGMRLENLDANLKTNNVNNNRVSIIPTLFVSGPREAMEKTVEWMNEGYEGGILKCRDNVFIDHTSPTQLKIKLEIAVDVRCTGFTDGKKGTKREATFGAMTFETDDGKIKGQTSGFNDKQLADFNSRRDELVGQVFTVVCTDITKGRDNDYYALLHPRFDEFRNDKDTTDTLERAFEQKESAMTLSNV